MDHNVSRIHEHDLRSVWENEARDFTQWLTENIDLLASELGIEIEDHERRNPSATSWPTSSHGR